MTNALTGIAVLSVVAAIVGTYIFTRRLIFLSGGVTHACFGGLGMGYWLGISPEATAAVFAVGSSLGAEWLTHRRVRSDSSIAVIWAVGMALGILFIFLSSGYVPELNSFLFGNVLTISTDDIILSVCFVVAIACFYLFFYSRIVAVSFDEDFARTRGLPVRFINIAMTVFTAVAIVIVIRMIGIMLLMSMLSLPQMTAELFTRRYTPLMFLSMAISLAGGLGGLAIAWFISVPASAAIVLLLAALYLAAMVVRNLRK